MGAEAHRQEAGNIAVQSAILTISDTRLSDTDRSGQTIRQLLEQAGHDVLQYAIVPDEHAKITSILHLWSTLPELQCLLLNGGTGIARRDRTIEAVTALLDKKLDGFGELFRMLSFQEIGAAAMLSRAVAGTMKGKLLFAMPGSTAAVRLAMEKLILPELPHLVRELTR